MTAAKQLQVIKWIASTFGIAIISLVIWGSQLDSQVKQNTGELEDLWKKYNEEGALYRKKVDQFEQKFKDMEDDEMKKLFNKYTGHEYED